MLTKKPPTDPSALSKGTAATSKSPATPSVPAAHLSKSPTKVTIKFNCGFGNSLFLRGDAAGLSWEKGAPLKNVDAETWIWESDRPFTELSFKVVLNDEQFELGENHTLKYGSSLNITPNF